MLDVSVQTVLKAVFGERELDSQLLVLCSQAVCRVLCSGTETHRIPWQVSKVLQLFCADLHYFARGLMWPPLQCCPFVNSGCDVVMWPLLTPQESLRQLSCHQESHSAPRRESSWSWSGQSLNSIYRSVWDAQLVRTVCTVEGSRPCLVETFEVGHTWC